MKTYRLENNKCGYSTRHSMYVRVVTMLAVSVLFILYLPPSYADPTVTWDFFGGVTLGDGSAGSFPNMFTITNPDANLDPEVVDTITATVSSIDPDGIVRDEIEITLSEVVSEDNPAFFDDPTAPDPNSGVFRNKNIIFTSGQKEYSLDQVVTIVQEDPDDFFGFYGYIPTSPETIDATDIVFTVISSSDLETFGAGFPITETGPSTQIYTGTIRFSTEAADFDSGTILVQPGDIVSIIDWGGNIQNALIVPNPDPRVGVLQAEIDDRITVTYAGIECADDLCDTNIGVGGGGGGGRGTGGPVLPSASLVVDVLGGLSAVVSGLINTGSGGPDHSPPSLITSRPSILGSLFVPDPFKPMSPTTDSSTPLKINNKGYFLAGYANTIEPEQVKTGEDVDITLSFLEASSVQHVALHFVDETSDELSDTDPTITFDNGNVIKSDPDGILGDQITFTTSKDGTHSIFNFGFSFDQPTKRHLMINAWDEKRNAANTKIFDAFDVSGQPIPQEQGHLILQDLGQYIITQDGIIDVQSQSDIIPQEQATWFYSNSIGRLDRHDMTLLHGTINNEQARAGTIIDNLDLDTQTFVAKDVTKPYDTKRAPQLTWSNVGHKLRDLTNPSENNELVKKLLLDEHLKAEKTLKAYLEQRNHRE